MSTRAVLGIDTSNYTTSTALYENGEVRQEKRLLPVKQGELGLRQSDAVFHHVQQLPDLLEALMKLDAAGKLGAIGCSTRPRALPGSYMPCFTVGSGTARALAAALGVPVHSFSHQQGHIAAAAYSAGHFGLLDAPLLAFHVSGGTTEAVLVQPDGQGAFTTQLLAQSLDLKGGQAVDRVGRMLGLPFPAGPALEKLAARSDATYKIRPSMKGACCSLSGVENQCQALLDRGAAPCDVARYCLCALLAALDAMAAALLRAHPGLPLLFAGGVMANAFLRDGLQEKYGAHFAQPAFSADNAAGVALLAARKEGLLCRH